MTGKPAVDETSQLIRAAWTVLRRSGFEGFKVQLVLRETGLSARSFYRHFANKDALLVTLIEDEYARTARRLGDAVADVDDPIGQVAAWIRELVLAAGDPRRLARARLFSSQQGVMRRFPDQLARANRLLLEPLEVAIAQGCEGGLFPWAEPGRDAELIARLAGSTMSDALIEPRRTTLDEVVDTATAFALRALGHPPT